MVRWTQEQFDETQNRINARRKHPQAVNNKPQTNTMTAEPETAKPKRGKHRNVFTEYNGIKYHSKAEADFAARLDVLKSAGAIASWKRQPRFFLIKASTRSRYVLARDMMKYTADFLVQLPDGSRYVVDVKGYEKQRDRDVEGSWAQFGPYPLHVVYGNRTEIIPAGGAGE